MSGSYADPGSKCCPGCGAKSEIQVSHERRGDFMMYRCGDEEPRTSKGCGASWENTSLWARAKTGVGHVREDQAGPMIVTSFSHISQERWDSIFAKDE